jgi:hypothetical protein
MARLVFGMNQSLDGRHMYEIMCYWDDDHAEWDADERAFAAAWRMISRARSAN